MTDVKPAEALAFYAFQSAIEVIHSHTYSLLIDTYIKEHDEKMKLLNAINTIPCVNKKAQWALKWTNDDKSSFAVRCVAYACVEGIFFSGSFCAIFWLKEKGLMDGLTFSNELISRDEALHTDFAVLLYSMLNNKLSYEVIKEIVMEAVEIEKEFIIDSLPCSLLGMNADLMTEHIEYIADRLVLQLGYEKIYNRNKTPFDFMVRLGMDQKTNFFENKVSSYARAEDVHNVEITLNTEDDDF